MLSSLPVRVGEKGGVAVSPAGWQDFWFLVGVVFCVALVVAAGVLGG